jgi:hypothetical protein
VVAVCTAPLRAQGRADPPTARQPPPPQGQQPAPPAAPASSPDLLRLTRNLPGDAKPLQIAADEIATWLEDGKQVVLMRGRVLVQQGVVQVRAQQAAAWIDVQGYKARGIWHVDLYAEGEVRLDNSSDVKDGTRAFLDLNTRGEVKLSSSKQRVTQQAIPREPLYQRALTVLIANMPAARPAPQPPPPPPTQQAPPPQFPPLPPQPQPPPPPQPLPPHLGAAGPAGDSGIQLVQGIAGEPDRPVPSPSRDGAGPPRPAGSDPPQPGDRRPADGRSPGAGPQPSQGGAGRARPSLAVSPRQHTPFNTASQQLGPNEWATIITGGVIVTATGVENIGTIDLEADRVVIFSQGESPLQAFQGPNQGQGKSGIDATELYLSGNVEVRRREGKAKTEQLLTAAEVYYDVGRRVAVAVTAQLDMRQPPITDPIQVRADEILQTSETTYEILRAEVYSSKLPDDPGLKVYMASATIEDREVPRMQFFGLLGPAVDRKTGKEIKDHQTWVKGQDAVFSLEGVPFLYLPYIVGDAREPLGPITDIAAGYNQIFGALFGVTLNMYNLLGLQPYDGTSWKSTVDYMSRRGPAAGTIFTYQGVDPYGWFGPEKGKYDGMFRLDGMYDQGQDVLGGDGAYIINGQRVFGTRGQTFTPPDFSPDGFRGRLLWRQDVRDLPDGFSFQSQAALLSDRNYLEQYFKKEHDDDLPQKTYFYVKEQMDNWAWTGLASVHPNEWITETAWLPRLDGYLIGQSFFDRLTYSAHASAAWARLYTTTDPEMPVSPTDVATNTARLDFMQKVGLPLTLGPIKFVPYLQADLAYYSLDLQGDQVGRVWGGGGATASLPLSQLFPNIQSDLLNLNGINHKITLAANYFVAQTNEHYLLFPQLDRWNDDSTDQAVRDVRGVYPITFFDQPATLAALTQPAGIADPQRYAIRSLLTTAPDTLDDIQVLQLDLNQRWQTKRGYPGFEHILDWITLDVQVSLYPDANRDNFGKPWGLLMWDFAWNVGDRTALFSNGWVDPFDQGTRLFNIGMSFGRTDRTSLYLGYTQIDPLETRAVTASISYMFSPKYFLTASSVYDFGTSGALSNSVVVTRVGTDLTVSLGFTYSVLTSSFGLVAEVVPNLVPANRRTGPMGVGGAGSVLH